MFRVMSTGQIKGGVKNIFKLSGRRSPWGVDITVLGKRQRRFFATKREALDYLDNWKLARKMDLQYFISLSGEQIKDIKDAMDAIPRGKTLLQSVRKAWRFFSEYNLHELADKYHEIKKNRRDSGSLSEGEYTHIKGRVTDFKKHFGAFADVTLQALLAYLRSKGAPKTVALWKGTISEILDFCIKKGAIAENPIRLIHGDELIAEKTAGIRKRGSLSVDEARAFMSLLERKYPQYCRFFALLLFSGIRVEEAPRMKDEYFRYDERKIVFPAQIGKVKKAWTLEDLPENLWVWLEKYKNTPIKRPSNTLRTALGKRLGLPENFSRHSFSTYHLSLYFDSARTSKITRNSEQVLKDRYFDALVDKETAKAYFEILPCDS